MKMITNKSPNSVESLFLLANEDNPAGISARNLLSAYRLLNYEATVQIPDTTLKSTLISDDYRKPVSAKTETLLISPNPADDYIVVAYQLENIGELNIVASDGRLVYTRTLNPGKNQTLVRTNSLTSGVYTAKLTDGKKSTSVKFIIK